MYLKYEDGVAHGLVYRGPVYMQNTFDLPGLTYSSSRSSKAQLGNGKVVSVVIETRK